MIAGTYTVKEAADLAHVTVRTLHHYDDIGLLQPSGRGENGYRHYSTCDLERLHQILLLRTLGFSLEAIKQVLDDPGYDRRKALLAQRELLREQARRTEQIIQALEAALTALEGGKSMNPDDLFNGFENNPYEDEARERWGDTDSYKESMRRVKNYGKEDWARYKAESEQWGKELTALYQSGASPQSPEAMALAERHRQSIDKWFYPCSHEMQVGLGEMYLADERFKANYERMAPGLTEFLVAAIKANASKH